VITVPLDGIVNESPVLQSWLLANSSVVRCRTRLLLKLSIPSSVAYFVSACNTGPALRGAAPHIRGLSPLLLTIRKTNIQLNYYFLTDTSRFQLKSTLEVL